MSYGKVHKIEVARACRGYIENHKKFVQRIREELIHEEMKPKKFLWITYGAKTYEEAKAYLEDADDMHEYHLCKITGGKWLMQIRDLLDLCEIRQTEPHIELSAKHADLLKPYF